MVRFQRPFHWYVVLSIFFRPLNPISFHSKIYFTSKTWCGYTHQKPQNPARNKNDTDDWGPKGMPRRRETAMSVTRLGSNMDEEERDQWWFIQSERVDISHNIPTRPTNPHSFSARMEPTWTPHPPSICIEMHTWVVFD
jgi:hypothetical protein